MSTHPVLHLLHDAGAAAWFGGSLMGATGLNAAASQLDDPRQRALAATSGWSRWAPVNAAAVAAHVVGAVGLARTDAARVATQAGVGRSTAAKTAVTGAALGTAAWSLLLNRQMAAAGAVPVQGATEPSAATPAAAARAQRQLKLVQWLNPLVTGAVIVVGAWQEEQQRTSQVVPGVLRGLAGRAFGVVPGGLPTVAALGVAAGVLSRRRSNAPVVEAYPPPPVVTRPAPVVVAAPPVSAAEPVATTTTTVLPTGTYGGSA